jgi:hypothetical protein
MSISIYLSISIYTYIYIISIYIYLYIRFVSNGNPSKSLKRGNIWEATEYPEDGRVEQGFATHRRVDFRMRAFSSLSSHQALWHQILLPLLEFWQYEFKHLK